MTSQKHSTSPFSFSKRKHHIDWFITHLKILEALNDGCKTTHEIYLFTGISYPTIRKHRKEITECPNCHNFINKEVFCSFCRYRLVESYG